MVITSGILVVTGVSHSSERLSEGQHRGGLSLLHSSIQQWKVLLRHRLSLTLEDDSSNHDGIRMALGRCMGVFYADSGMIGLMDPECLQWAINVLINIFRRVILIANVDRSNTMTCQ